MVCTQQIRGSSPKNECGALGESLILLRLSSLIGKVTENVSASCTAFCLGMLVIIHGKCCHTPDPVSENLDRLLVIKAMKDSEGKILV